MIFNKPKTFISQVQALNRGESADPELIWRSFQCEKPEENVSYFCLQLFSKVLDSSKKIYLLQNEERLYATLLCMELYKNKKPKRTETIEECRSCIQEKASTHGKGFMHFLFQSDREDALVQFFVSRLALVPTDLNWNQNICDQIQKQVKESVQYMSRIRQSHSHKNYQVLKKSSFPKYQIFESKLLSFGYMCFIDHVKSNHNILTYSEFESIKNVLKASIQGMKNHIYFAQTLVLIVHLLIKCVTLYGCFYESILKQLIIFSNQLRMLPISFSTISNQLFNAFYEQLKIPGTAFRKKLRKDFPALDMKDSVFLNREFYLISESDEDLYGCHQDQSLTTLRKLILLHIFKISKVDQPANIFVNFLKTLDNEASEILYGQCTKIVDLLSKLDNVLMIRKKLKEYISKVLIDAQQKYKNNKINVDTIEAEQFQTMSQKVNQFGMFDYPKFSIVSINIKEFTSEKQNSNNLSRIIQKNKANFSPQFQNQVKIPIIFYGDGLSFNKLIQQMADYLMFSEPRSLHYFSIYYIPHHGSSFRSGLNDYISCKDGWYRRFVANIFQQKMLYPYLQINERNKDLFPFYINKKNLQLFIRDATYSFPLRIYKCQLLMNGFDIPENVYMASNLTMGLFCQAEIIKMAKEKQKGKQERYSHKELIQVIEQKIKKIPMMTLQIEIEYLQAFTNELKIKKQDRIKVEDLQICNLPHDYFLGKQPNPSSLDLEMTILTESNGKTFRRQVLHSENFKERRSQDEVSQAFQDLFICESIRRITINNLDKNNSLRLMIDGNVASKIDKITIQPAFTQNDIPICLPIKCFLPI